MAVERSPHYYFSHLDFSKISVARELSGLTKKELAEKIGKTPSAVTQYESGKLTPSLDTFESLGKALSVPLSFLSTDSQPLPDASLERCHFRANRRVPQIARQQALSFARRVFSVYSFLIEQGVRFPELTLPSYKADLSGRQIEYFSMKFREDLGLGSGPIYDMAQLVEGLGVRIVLLQSNAVKLDGFATWLDDTPCVIVDANSPASRMQFDYAHELAHLIFDEDNPPDDVLVERRANMFASALLMPKESFTADCPKRYSSRMYASVKQQWHVSIAAILYRARALGIISEASYKSAQISRTRMGVRIDEEAEFQQPVPTLLDQGMALISDDIRLDEMALDLGMTVQELRTILLLQKVSMDVIDKMMPKHVKAHIFDFSVYRDKE